MDEVKKRRMDEAMLSIKKAEDFLKTSMFKMKFKPDYDSAAIEYDRAAVCFKNSGEVGRSRDTYLKTAEIHRLNGSLFHAAKCTENAALLCKEMGDSDGAMKHMECAADGYAESGSSDTSAMALDKAAKFLEEIDPDKAIQIYRKALVMVQQTDRSGMAGNFLNRLIKLLLKLERYKEAAEAITEEIEKYMEVKESGRVGQLTTALVLVQLARGDSIEAAKSMQRSFRSAGFEESEDANICNALISAYESGEQNRFKQVLQRPILRNMDNEYLRLMKTLKVSSILMDGGAAENDSDGEDLK